MKVVQTHISLMRRAVKALGGQREAAKFFGISQSTVSRICSGKLELPRSIQMLAILVVKGKIDV